MDIWGKSVPARAKAQRGSSLELQQKGHQLEHIMGQVESKGMRPEKQNLQATDNAVSYGQGVKI